jgi:hydroxyacylglutathione hydrolase
MDNKRMPSNNLHIYPIPAFEDNYIWLLHNKRDAIVIDPGDATPVIDKLEELALNLSAILITHHHSDHIDGVAQLLKQHPVPVYAPQYEEFPFEHISLADGNQINLNEIDLQFDIMWLPGHTLGHIAYVNESYLFCGDVLFSAGCGRLFEGTAEQMLASLNRLKKLTPETKVFCTHEYTAKNIDFALTLEPDNLDLHKRKIEVARLRKNHLPTIPSSIALELKTNPFLRCDQKTIIANASENKDDELSIFSKIRTLRNHY